MLKCDHELGNDYNLFVTKTYLDAEFHPQIVAQLLLGISRFKKFLLDVEPKIISEPSSDEDVIMGSFLTMSVNEDPNIGNRKDCTKCPYKREGGGGAGGGGEKSLKNVTTIPDPKSVMISEFF